MPSKQHPNLLIVMSDEHAPMYSGPYGHPLVQTPHMDRLAEEGVYFHECLLQFTALYVVPNVLYDW